MWVLTRGHPAFWYLFKTFIVLYLALPQFRGAEYIYHTFIRPVITKRIINTGVAPGTH